ncbi:MAG TPA: hypothetical protein VH187_18605 [Scandinavium sp.]|jgi:hypothetical protein|uniref:hypothetical protein n=1 Tax=Scandinavium sp. TaxID=2830653 RepID=UPI002E34FF22|nr:hypothetical protein [Scandinavium sp.]HEX4503150.1 hypothetical protein [Scandinavium sp.]
MMKILPILFVALSVTACQAKNAPQPQPMTSPIAAEATPAPQPVVAEAPPAVPSTDLQDCRDKINELKRYDRKQYNSLRNSLAKVLKEKSLMSGSEKFAAPETVGYIRYQQDKSISMICTQASQKLDKMMVKKALASAY